MADSFPVLAALAVLAFTFIPYPSANSVGSGWFDAFVLLTVLVSAVGAHIFRFKTTTDPLQRRQLRTVGVAIVLYLVTFIAFNVALDIGNLDDPDFPPVLGVILVLSPLFAIPSVLLAVVLGASVARDRLFEIEVALNRSVVFVSLTIAVALLYAAVVGGAAALFHVNASGFIAVIAAAAVALVIQPLRSRLQRAANRLLYGQRDEPYSVISQLAQRMESTVDGESVPAAVVEAVTSTLKLPYAAIATQNGAVIAESGTPVRTVFAAPIVHRGETIGHLNVAPWQGTALAKRDRRLIEDLALQAGAAIHAVTLHEDLLQSRQRLVNAREEERRRIRRDLHDGLGPRLASLMMRIETERERGPANAEPNVMTDLAERVNEAIADIRRLVYGLRPPALDDLGLVGALTQATTLSAGGPAFRLVSNELPPLPAAVEVAAFRIAEEGMTNALRHSGASECLVSLHAGERSLVVTIEDDGRGVPDGARPGVGMRSMRERAEELGGQFEVVRRAVGTSVRAVLPLSRESLESAT